MRKRTSLTTFWSNLPQKTGAGFLLIAGVVTQTIVSPMVVIILQAMQTEIGLGAEGFYMLSIITGGIMIGNNLVLLAWMYLFNPDLWKALAHLKKGESPSREIAKNAWKQITSIAWRYGVVILIISFFTRSIYLVLYPLLAFHYHPNFELQQSTIILIGDILELLLLSSFSILVLELLLTPIRELLTPESLEEQLAGVGNVSILIKMLSIVLSLVFAALLLTLPLGYTFTIRALAWTGDSHTLLIELEHVAIQTGIKILLLSAFVTALFSRTIAYPIRQMLEVFQKVEAGDLSQRAKIIATDEVGDLEIHFNRMISTMESLQNNLEEEVERQTQILYAGLEIGRVANEQYTAGELEKQIVSLLASRMGYYYTAIFLVDSTARWADLSAASSASPTLPAQQKRRFEINGQNAIGAAISLRQPQVLLGDESPALLESARLPGAAAEIVFPLISGNRVLGALDIQSDQEGMLTPDCVDSLEIIANQISITLENARLIQDMQANLQELRGAQRQYIAESWASLLRQSEIVNTDTENDFGFEETDEAAEKVKVPLALRDQIIGEIMLESDTEWTEEDIGWLEEIATQAALALENARLLEKSQQIALHERLVAEITQRIWASSTVDHILQTAIKELGDTLGASEAEIEIKIEEE